MAICEFTGGIVNLFDLVASHPCLKGPKPHFPPGPGTNLNSGKSRCLEGRVPPRKVEVSE